jgi:hypothetical protein
VDRRRAAGAYRPRRVARRGRRVGRESEVKIAVGDLAVERVELAAEIRLAGTELRHSRAEFVKRDQLFLERLDHTGDGSRGLRECEFDLSALALGWIRITSLAQPAVDLGADEGRIADQFRDVFPHDVVEVVGADRLVPAHAAVLVAVVVGTEAPVVVDLLVRGPGRGSIVAVAAGRRR